MISSQESYAQNLFTKGREKKKIHDLIIRAQRTKLIGLRT